MIARSILLRASRSGWLARQAGRRAFARRAVKRFMPGETAAEALDAAERLGADGFGTILTCLGEQVTATAEAAAVRDHYLDLFDAIRSRGVPTAVSVKLTHLGLDVDPETCARSVLTLARKAAETGSLLWIDMEESVYVDRTLEIVRRVRAADAPVGVCLQAYLRRTAADLESLLPLQTAVRLVKGAYRERREIAFTARPEVDAAFERLAGRLLEHARAGGAPAVLGTHDMALVTRLRAGEAAPGADRFEVHMLYGIGERNQRALAGEGVPVRVLISYGERWFPWYMRRLAERPANVWFVLRSLVG